jgi:hypothetical protein
MEIKTNVTPARYFDKRIEKSDKGLVNKSSIVPDRRSSEIILIVIAGIRIIKMNGEISKNGIILDSPDSRRFEKRYLLLGMIQCNKPDAMR